MPCSLDLDLMSSTDDLGDVASEGICVGMMALSVGAGSGGINDIADGAVGASGACGVFGASAGSDRE